MADFKTALQALSRGQLSEEQIVANLDKLLRKSPKLAPQILGELREAYGSDLINAQVYASLKKRVQDIAGVPVAAGGDADEATRFAGGADDATEMLTDADRSAIAEEARTQVDTGRTGGGDTTGGVDFDLSSPSTGTGADSWTPSTGTGATGTGWSQPGRGLPAEPLKIEPGTVIKERFRLHEVLGVGGMGTVYRGVDLLKEEARDRNPYVALKVLNEDFKQHPDAFIALQREASRQQKLAHPNIATVYDFDRTGATVYIVMELMEGMPLNNYIKKTVRAKGGLSFEEAWPIVQGLGAGLIYAHERKMVHSDFKPGNCFLLKDGNVKILDFGIARAVKNPLAAEGEGEKTLFDPGKLGALTPAYASAEMLEGEDPDTRDDIYALACVAYELMTGKHPFNKLPANAARDNKLLPAPVKGLTRRQMKGLMRGLGFARKDRSQTVQQFLEEFEGKSYWYKNPFVIAGAAAALIAIAGIGPLVGYLESKKIDAAIADLASGDAARIELQLQQLPKLGKVPDPAFDQEAEIRILEQAREGIVGYYESQVNARVAANDYPGANALLEQLALLYPDSTRTAEVKETFDQNRNTLLARLEGRYQSALDEGRLLPDESADDVGDVLAALRQVQANHPLLADPRLSAALSRQAEQALANLDFDGAARTVQEGEALIALFAPGKKDITLLNMRDKVGNERERAEQSTMIASAEDAIRGRQDTLTDLPAYGAVGDAIATLARLAPENALFGEVSAKLRPLLDAEIARVRGSQDWAAADPLVGAWRPMVSALGYDAALFEIDTGSIDFNRTQDGLLGRLVAAVAAGNLAPDAAAVAAEIEAAAPGSPRALAARALVARAHLRQARLARAAGDFDKARKDLAAAQALKPDAATLAALAAESDTLGKLEKLDAAGREALAASQQAEVSAAQQQVDAALAALVPTPVGTRAVLAAVDRLEALAPTDPKIVATRTSVADRLAEAADTASKAGDWSIALANLRDGLGLMPESTRLAQTLARLQDGAATAIAAAKDKAIADGKAELERLAAAPTFDREWNAAVQVAYAKLAPIMPANDPWLVETGRRLAGLYVTSAAQLRAEQRYEQAGSLLAKAERYAPDLPELASERTALASAEAQFKQAQEEELRKAEIDSLKQSLVTQAKAKDVSNAKTTLDKLKALVPADDPFVTQEVPKLLADAYLKFAESQEKKGNVLAALRIAREGLAIAPDNAGLKQAERAFAVDGSVAELEKIYREEVTPDKAAVQKLWADLQALNGTRYAEQTGVQTQTLLARINPLLAGTPTQNQYTEACGLYEALGKDVLPPSEGLTAVGERCRAGPGPAKCDACTGISKSLGVFQLSAAQKLLVAALEDPAVKDHPQLKGLDARLKKALAAGEEAVKVAQAEQGRLEDKKQVTQDEYDQAKYLIESIGAAWQDYPQMQSMQDWLKELEKKIRRDVTGPAGTGAVLAPGRVTQRTPVAPYTAASPAVCKDALAGYGLRKKGQCFSWVDANKRGPMMVVVPAGGGNAQAFAISKYEVTYFDYNHFCTVSGWCKPFPVSKEKLPLPVTGIRIEDAKAYLEWLSRRTGATWRLPTAAEWQYAAEAAGKQPKKDYNCRLEQGGQVLKGSSVMAVNTGKPNGWGLFHYVGNVQEWVTSGAGIVVRGGAFQDSFSKCDISLERPHDGTPDEVTGFRVVRELG